MEKLILSAKVPPSYGALLESLMLFVSVTVISTTCAQTLSFHHLTADNGLSISFVYSIFQDSRGFMWFGGDGGLIRFDGINYENYSAKSQDPNSLKGIHILKILKDKNGNLWMGTDAALNCYHRDRDNFTSYTPKNVSANNNFSDSEFLWVNDSILVLKNELQYLKFNIISKAFSTSSSEEYERTLLNIAARERKHYIALWDDSCSGIQVLHFDAMKNVVDKTFFCNQLTNTSPFVQSVSAMWICKRNSIIALNPETERYSGYSLSVEKTSLLDSSHQLLAPQC